MSPPADTPNRDIYTVSRLNAEARAVLEGSFPLLWVEGEISNLARPASGHWYFSLKDSAAQVRCAMFRQRNQLLRFKPQDGMHVLIRARLSLYEGRGEFQLIVEHMEEAGSGALQRAFEMLKLRLQNEGLFDAARKRPLPRLPRCIGVVTSPTGAAIRDILTVLARRFPSIPVVIYPVPVQGSGAGEQIAAAIRRAGERAECDVLIVGRGGGSLEDLWAFNEEVVARAIHASPLPIVSAVGHEIDFTIADFVADRRAPTPSAAAELLSPDREEMRTQLLRQRIRLARSFQRQMRHKRERLAALQKRLKHPGRRLQEIAQRLDEMEQRLSRASRHLLRHAGSRLAALHARLERHTPLYRVQALQTRHNELQRRLHRAAAQHLERLNRRLAQAAHTLDAVSPLATLGRGYAIVTSADGSVLRAAAQTAPGAQVQARLGQGRLLCRVEDVEP
ncbi:MAG: exodeoxyribonuclease VII large subunit [Thiohalomonadaceae bacterium]